MRASRTDLHLNLDDAWPNDSLGLPVVDARDWGPQVRFSAPARLIERFCRQHETNLASPFLLYGSGDFEALRRFYEAIVGLRGVSFASCGIQPSSF